MCQLGWQIGQLREELNLKFETTGLLAEFSLLPGEAQGFCFKAFV